MKRVILIIMIFIKVLPCFSQAKDPTHYSIGAGLNFFPLILRADRTITKSTPLYNIGADYFVGKNVSIGPSFSYQRLSLIDTASGLPIGQAPYIRLNRISPGVRALVWNKLDNETGLFNKINLFLGFRLSYDFIELGASNIMLASGYTAKDLKIQRFTRQILAGGRIKIQKRWGVFGELGIGAPYFMMAGFFVN